MQITLLGTGSAEGMPALFCNCPVCIKSRATGGKNFRTRSTASIDGVLKIDLPPDTLAHVQYQNIDLTGLDFLLFTHAHDDHFAPAELQYLSWMFVPTPIEKELNVYGPADVVARLKQILDIPTLPMKVQCLDPWETIKVGDFEITSILAQHDPKQVCFNYIISREATSVLYATDTGWYGEQTWAFLKGRRLDGAIIDCSKGMDENGYKGHLSVPEVIRAKEKMLAEAALKPAAKVITTHHSHLSRLMHDELESLLNPHGIEVGYDGLTVSI